MFFFFPRDVSEPPKQISNPIGEIFLRKGDFTSQSRSIFFSLLFLDSEVFFPM